MKKRRSRIQIGSGGVVFLLVTALILSAAIYTQANLLFWAFGLMIGGLFASVLLSWQTLRNVQVQRLLPSSGIAGDPMVIRYHLTNKSWMPAFSVVIVETWGKGRRGWRKTGPVANSPPQLLGRPHGWLLHIGPNQTMQAEAPCWPLTRGPLRFERIVLSTTFPFNILRKVVEVQQSGTVLIYPHLYRINRRLLFSLSSIDPSGKQHLDRGGGTEEFFGLRQYRAGDSLKMIDWKRSARTNELITREMTQPSPPRMLVLLDLRKLDEAAKESAEAAGIATNPPKRKGWRKRKQSAPTHKDLVLERTISLAASLICEAYFQGYQVGLTVAGAACASFPVHHSLPHRTKILEALAQLDMQRPLGAADGLAALPSVVVWPGHGDGGKASATGQGTTVLGAADMDQYVSEVDGGFETFLMRRNRPQSKRDELAGSEE